MIRRKSVVQTVLAGLLVFVGAQATAVPITIDPAVDSPVQSGDSAECQASTACKDKVGTSAILSWLASQGYDVSGELYKSDEDGDATGSDSGPFAANFTVTFSNSVGDPQDATISHTDGWMITDSQYLLIKDGKNSPIWYLYDISAWDGWTDINLINFWPNMGAISHVSIYGGVPEPGTLALFGIALVGFGLARRRRTVRKT